MAGLFGTLISMKRTINTDQAAVNTTAHNISNSQTDGYTRQRVDMTASMSTDVYTQSGRKQVGTGVEISDISRIRDVFLDAQIRDENANLGKFQSRDEFMSEIETLTLEPSSADDDTKSLSELTGEMWDSWQKLVDNPQNPNSKTAVREASLSVTNELNHLSKQLDTINDNCKIEAKQNVETFNSTLQQISDLNKQIFTTEISKGVPNDLLDKRDALVDNLSKMMDIKVIQGENGLISITTSSKENVGGTMTLVDRTILDSNGFEKLSFNDSDKSITWSDTDPSKNVTDDNIDDYKGGSISGYISVTKKVTEFQNRLDAYAKAIAAAVNTVHNTYYNTTDSKYESYTGGANYIPVFTSCDGSAITAKNITVNQVLQDDPGKLRTGLTADVSDTGIALAIAEIKDANLDIGDIYNNPSDDVSKYIACDGTTLGKLTSTGTGAEQTISSFYQDFILKVGTFANESKNMTAGQKELVNQLLSRKDSTSGVSKDEETVNLVEYEHSLNAAFKVISVVDDLLSSVIGLIK